MRGQEEVSLPSIEQKTIQSEKKESSVPLSPRRRLTACWASLSGPEEAAPPPQRPGPGETDVRPCCVPLNHPRDKHKQSREGSLPNDGQGSEELAGAAGPPQGLV